MSGKTNRGLFTRACVSRSVVSDFVTPWTVPARLLCPWNSPGKNTGVGSHSLLQGVFLTQGSNLGLLHCRQILYHLSHQGTPVYSYNAILFGLQKKKKKKRKILPCATLWINLESVVLSEKSPSQKEFTEVNGYPEESIS